jgi:hypothetical protein
MAAGTEATASRPGHDDAMANVWSDSFMGTTGDGSACPERDLIFFKI